MSADSVYFAAKSSKETVSVLMSRAEYWTNNLEANGYLDKLRMAWAAYHGAYYSDVSTGHQVTFGGTQGELAQLPVNHIRNLAEHIIVMITANRPTMEARATNSDYKSLVQTNLANGLLDYYMREKRMEKYLKRAVEYAVVLGAGFIKMNWNATTGPLYDINEDTNSPIYEGDAEFTNLSPFDVIMDSTKEDQNHDWLTCRTWKNRFDLAAKYPELADKIIKMPTKSETIKFRFSGLCQDETDDVAIYEFYHKRTECLPDGRYILFLSDDIVLYDGPLPYRTIPVFRISPSDILGTPYGYTSLFDLLPLQEALNAMYSAVLSNNNAFAVQNILVPRGADISVQELVGGLNIIEANLQAGKPEALNLCKTAPETYSFMKTLEQQMETLSGINSVARGNPEASLKSGTALALVQSMAIQFMSGLQQSYVELIEDVGTGLINMLRDFAAVPRVAAIVGRSHRAEMKEFNGNDLNNINRVIVDVGNPLSRCLAKDTPVLMSDGTTKLVQNIKVGDLVMGPDSKRRTVKNVSSGKEQMYKVVSKDPHRKIEYGCNESHILTLKYCSDDYRYGAKKGDIIDLSIKEYNTLTHRQKRLLQGFTVGVEFPKKDLPIDPYILGAWLGDGTSATTALTTMDKEIEDAWCDYAAKLGLKVRVQENRQPNKSKVYFITSGEAHGASNRNKFMNALRELELINNKHIPQYYKTSSREDRLQLLAGLLDTDGYLIENGGTFKFIQKSDRLSNDVVFLAKSLGFRVTYKKQDTASSELTGPIQGEVNSITIGGNTWEIPNKLPRKQAKPAKKARDWLNYGINVVPQGEGTYYGFTLEEEPHFLLGDFTVTHNTTAGRVQMAEQLLQMKAITDPAQYFTVINTGRLDVMDEGEQAEVLLIRDENEKMLSGQSVPVIGIDEHKKHIIEHRSLLADTDLRSDANLTKLVLDHIQAHINALKTTDPALLQLIGEQPLPPPAPPGPPPGMPQGGPPPMAQGSNQQRPPMPSPGPIGQQPPIAGAPMPPVPPQPIMQQMAPGMRNAGMPRLPTVNPALLPNPQLQEALMHNLKK